jgi:hypothetical protein
MEKKKLFVDIETSPCEGYFWRPGHKVNISHENITRESEIICIAYKWEGEKKVQSLKWDYKAKSRDKKMLLKFSQVYSQALEVVAHNGKHFDVKWLRTRILINGLPPLPNIRIFDTLEQYRRYFNFNSNRLEYVSRVLGFDGKDKMSFSDWKAVMKGDNAILNKMDKYCKRDVKVLEEIENVTRPHIPEKVNRRMLTEFNGHCPTCEHKLVRYGFYDTGINKYQNWRCTNEKHRKVWLTTFVEKR